MRFSDFHLHCSLCHGEGDPEQFVEVAINLGLAAIGFSSHAPLPLDNRGAMAESDMVEYCSTIRKLEKKYQGKIKMYLGMEIDYFPGLSGPGSRKFRDLGLDYTIGSVHFMRDDLSGKYLSIAGS